MNIDRKIDVGHKDYLGMFTDAGNLYLKQLLDALIVENLKYGVPANAIYDTITKVAAIDDFGEAHDTDVREHAFDYVAKKSTILVPEV
jgi:hypothetical protein